MRHLQSSLTGKGHAQTKRNWAIWAKKRADDAAGGRVSASKINDLWLARVLHLATHCAVETMITEERRANNLGKKIPPNYLPGQAVPKPWSDQRMPRIPLGA